METTFADYLVNNKDEMESIISCINSLRDALDQWPDELDCHSLTAFLEMDSGEQEDLLRNTQEDALEAGILLAGTLNRFTNSDIDLLIATISKHGLSNPETRDKGLERIVHLSRQKDEMRRPRRVEVLRTQADELAA